MDLAELKKLWNGLDDIPIVDDEDGDTVIDSDYYIWEKGTEWNHILHWFDEKCPHGFGEDLMGDVPHLIQFDGGLDGDGLHYSCNGTWIRNSGNTLD